MTTEILSYDQIKELLRNRAIVSNFEFSIERDSLGTINPQFNFSLTRADNGNMTFYEIPWNPKIEELFLHEFPKKCQTIEQEIERVGNILSNNFFSASQLYGEKSVRVALSELLKENSFFKDDFSKHSKKIIKSSLGNITPDDSSFFDCKNFINHAINGLLNTIGFFLEYKNDAIEIVSNGLRISLQDTFKLNIDPVPNPKV